MVINVSFSKNFYIGLAFEQESPIAHVNKFRNQFFQVRALSKVTFWFNTVFIKRV